MARVLIVDDEEAACRLLKRVLTKEGHEVEVAYDGDQALELIYTKPEFNLVLLDLRMPRFTGWDFLRMKQMSKRLDRTAVIIMTGSSAEEIQAMGGLEGAAMIFEKPLSLDRILRVLENTTRDTVPPPPPVPKEMKDTKAPEPPTLPRPPLPPKEDE